MKASVEGVRREDIIVDIEFMRLNMLHVPEAFENIMRTLVENGSAVLTRPESRRFPARPFIAEVLRLEDDGWDVVKDFPAIGQMYRWFKQDVAIWDTDWRITK